MVSAGDLALVKALERNATAAFWKSQRSVDELENLAASLPPSYNCVFVPHAWLDWQSDVADAEQLLWLRLRYVEKGRLFSSIY